MRLSLLTISCLFSLMGCMGAARTSMPEAERTFSYALPHTKTQALAYQAAELWAAETFISAKTVADLKQPGDHHSEAAGGLVGRGRRVGRSILVDVFHEDHQSR